MTKVLIIAGPTASGKSAYALKLAQAHAGVIMNADSLQVYKGLEILTAQPSPSEPQTLPHRLYGIFEPWMTCSVGKWLPLVLAEIKAAHEAAQTPIVVGGTGLYLKVLMEGLPPLPPLNPLIRQEVSREETPSLYAELSTVDPMLAARLHPQDRQRIARGVEVFRDTGKPLSFWQNHPPVPPPLMFETHLCWPPPEGLRERIAHRLDSMIEGGALDEVARVSALPLSPPAQKAIGFKELAAHLKGELSLEAAKTLMLFQTHQYAKRQKTWFRHQFKADHVIEAL